MSDDKQLKQAVLDELNWEPSVNEAHIGVTPKAGVMTLMGHVESYTEKFAAEKAARRVKMSKPSSKKLKFSFPSISSMATRILPQVRFIV